MTDSELIEAILTHLQRNGWGSVRRESLLQYICVIESGYSEMSEQLKDIREVLRR